MHQLKLKPSTLHIAHQSELVDLKKQLVALQSRVEQLNLILSKEPASTHKRTKITIPNAEGFALVEIADILYCQALGNYTKVFTTTAQYLISKTLKSVVEMINHSDFIRCHQSYLINTKEVISFSSKKTANVELSNSTSVPVSRRKKMQVINAISARLGHKYADNRISLK